MRIQKFSGRQDDCHGATLGWWLEATWALLSILLFVSWKKTSLAASIQMQITRTRAFNRPKCLPLETHTHTHGLAYLSLMLLLFIVGQRIEQTAMRLAGVFAYSSLWITTPTTKTSPFCTSQTWWPSSSCLSVPAIDRLAADCQHEYANYCHCKSNIWSMPAGSLSVSL